ncbi:phosphotransferase [Actinopolymorpha sp. B9G3]|uniref:phosphotransferase enzyme family protein n=1 Tax=Actinopolymorpha sp. B9G3 TaxID=3158970 RepID=UPI0032D90B5A
MRQPSSEVRDGAVEAARRGFGLVIEAIEPIDTWSGAVFRVRTGHGPYALRAHEPGKRHPDMIRGELAFLRHLRSCGLPVPEPLQSSSGDDLFTASGGDSSPRYYDATTWMSGVVRRDGLAESDAHRLGVTLARIHVASLTFARLPQQSPPVHDEIWLLANASAEDVEPIAPWFSPSDQAVLEQALAKVRRRLAALDGSELEEGALHMDYTLGNCLWQDGDLSVIDFAEARRGPLLYDLAPMLTNIGDEPTLRRSFLAGYRSERSLSANQEAALPAMEAVRHINSCFAMIATAQQGIYGPALDVHLPYRLSEVRNLLPRL